MLKTIFLQCLRISQLNRILRDLIWRQSVSILLYHDITPENFRHHLASLTKTYTILPLATLIDALHTSDWSGIPPRSIVITFDDGARRFYDLKPVLADYRVPITHFLVTDVVTQQAGFWFTGVDDIEDYKRLPNDERLAALAERYQYSPEAVVSPRQGLQAEEIRELESLGVSFQSHTLTHPILTQCNDETSRREICESRSDVEQLGSAAVLAFSYPNGDYGERDIEHVQACGYLGARTVDLGVNRPGTDPYRLRILQTAETYDVERLQQIHILTLINGLVYAAQGKFDWRLRKKPL